MIDVDYFAELGLRYIEQVHKVYGENAVFVCGYEAGCLDFTLYHQLKNCNQECVILATTTMMEQRGRKRVKTDKCDATLIARCFAYHSYSPVHILTVSV